MRNVSQLCFDRVNKAFKRFARHVLERCERIKALLFDHVVCFQSFADSLEDLANDGKRFSFIAKMENEPQRLDRTSKFPHKKIVIMPKFVQQRQSRRKIGRAVVSSSRFTYLLEKP